MRKGGGWGGGFLKADTESEMEHVAYREISTECSLMNAPLYLCYNGGKRRLYDFFCVFFCFLSLSLALVWEFFPPGNKGCVRISDHAQKSCLDTAINFLLFVQFAKNDLSQTYAVEPNCSFNSA